MTTPAKKDKVSIEITTQPSGGVFSTAFRDQYGYVVMYGSPDNAKASCEGERLSLSGVSATQLAKELLSQGVALKDQMGNTTAKEYEISPIRRKCVAPTIQ